MYLILAAKRRMLYAFVGSDGPVDRIAILDPLASCAQAAIFHALSVRYLSLWYPHMPVWKRGEGSLAAVSELMQKCVDDAAVRFVVRAAVVLAATDFLLSNLVSLEESDAALEAQAEVREFLAAVLAR